MRGLHTFNEEQLIQFTDSRIVMAGSRVRRKPPKRADYLLKFTRDFTIAVVEAKAEDCGAGDRLQQAKVYAEMLGLKFAYATNGHSRVLRCCSRRTCDPPGPRGTDPKGAGNLLGLFSPVIGGKNSVTQILSIGCWHKRLHSKSSP